MIHDIATNYLNPLLKTLRFKHKRLVWNRTRGPFVDVITLQKAKYSTVDQEFVTGSAALCIPEFRAAILGSLPNFLVEADGIINVRFGELLENDHSSRALDRRWEITADCIDSVGLELSDIVERKAVPFLESFEDFGAIESYMERRSGWQAKTPYFQISRALVHWKIGNPNQSEKILSSINTWDEKVKGIREWIQQRSR